MYCSYYTYNALTLYEYWVVPEDQFILKKLDGRYVPQLRTSIYYGESFRVVCIKRMTRTVSHRAWKSGAGKLASKPGLSVKLGQGYSLSGTIDGHFKKSWLWCLLCHLLNTRRVIFFPIAISKQQYIQVLLTITPLQLALGSRTRTAGGSFWWSDAAKLLGPSYLKFSGRSFS